MLAEDGAGARTGEKNLRTDGFEVRVANVTGAGDTLGGTLT